MSLQVLVFTNTWILLNKYGTPSQTTTILLNVLKCYWNVLKFSVQFFKNFHRVVPPLPKFLPLRKSIRKETRDLLSPASAFHQPSNEFLRCLAFQVRAHIAGKGPFSMPLKLIVTFGNVVPERNVEVKLKLCLLGSVILPEKWWELQAHEWMARWLRSLGGEDG